VPGPTYYTELQINPKAQFAGMSHQSFILFKRVTMTYLTVKGMLLTRQ